MKRWFVNALVISALVLAGLVFALLAGCSKNNSELQAQLKQFTDERAMVETHLTRFDSLDFDIFSNQKWDLLNVSHADDIVVYWPDGHSTTGIEKQFEDLTALL